MRTRYVIFALVTIAACGLNPWGSKGTGTITGKVTNSEDNVAIVGALITTNPPSSTVVTEADTVPHFTFENVDVGTYAVIAKKFRFLTDSVLVKVSKGQNTSASITLSPTAMTDVSMKILTLSPSPGRK